MTLSSTSAMPQPATMNPVLRYFWQEPSRFKVLHGGRNSTKTWDAAANAIRIAQTVRVRILCTRQFQNKIEESVYTTIKAQIERFGLQDRFIVARAKIVCVTTGSEFLFYGIARNIAEIKGLEGVDILWIEEAESIGKDDYGVLEATIRSEDSEIWVVFNPQFATDFVYQYFVVDPPYGAMVRKINYTENPFISSTALRDILRLKEKDPDEYMFRYEGVPKNDDDRVIIKREWLESCIDAHTKLGIEPAGKARIGFDIADDGADKNAEVLFHGQMCVSCEEWKGLEDQLLKSCTKVWWDALLLGASIDFDCIGVGASAGPKFIELNEEHEKSVEFRKFNASGKIFKPKAEYKPGIKNRDHFSNLKAQTWWLVSDRVRETHMAVRDGEPIDDDVMISISSRVDGLNGLLTELATPFREFDHAGRVKVESKKDLLERQVPSPNRADGFIMGAAPLPPPPSFEFYVSGQNT